LALGVLRRNAACLASLRACAASSATAEAADERGRRRLASASLGGVPEGGAAREGRGRHHVVGGYREAGGVHGGDQGKWRSASLQGCPREVRLLLAGPYYYDVDMVNCLPNVARQLAGLGMVSEPNLQALRTLCAASATGCWGHRDALRLGRLAGAGWARRRGM
jgi:hypothetical protein